MNFRTFIRLSFVLSSFALLLRPAQAPRITFEELMNSSEFIVQGRVIRKWAGWDAKHNYIWTHHEVEVTDAIRGVTGSRVTVSEPGGEVDGIGQSFGGALPYAMGENVVLFLERMPVGFLRAVGGGQGKFTVGRDGRARANLAGMELVDVRGARPGTSLASIDGLALGEWKRRVRGAASLYPYRARSRTR